MFCRHVASVASVDNSGQQKYGDEQVRLGEEFDNDTVR